MPWSKRVATLPDWAREELARELTARVRVAAAADIDLGLPVDTDGRRRVAEAVLAAMMTGLPFVVEELHREHADREAGRVLTEEGVGYEPDRVPPGKGAKR